jgi:regulator of sirC expression with transglutaminase-like and TPR domain
VVYILVARDRVGLPFSGASTPGHFLIRYDGVEDEPLFIDAFNGGLILKQRDIKRFLELSKLPFDEAFLRPASPRAILLRMIRNLIIVFTEQQDEPARKAFDKFMKVIQKG